MSHLAIFNTPSGYPEWWDAAKPQKWKRELQDIQWHQSVVKAHPCSHPGKTRPAQTSDPLSPKSIKVFGSEPTPGD